MKTAQRPSTDAVRRAIDGARLTTAGLAERSGVSVRALTAYRQRARTPDDATRLRIAAAVEAHGLHLQDLAEELRESVED